MKVLDVYFTLSTKFAARQDFEGSKLSINNVKDLEKVEYKTWSNIKINPFSVIWITPKRYFMHQIECISKNKLHRQCLLVKHIVCVY